MEINKRAILRVCILLLIFAGTSMAQERPSYSSMYSGGLIPPDLEWWKANVPIYKPDSSPAKGSLDWRNYNGSNYTTPAKNQGICGSCAAFSGISVLESLMEIEWDQPNANYNMSEQHLFACSGGTCSGGASQTAILDYMKSSGVPNEDCFPYKSGYTGWDYSCSKTCSNWRDIAVKIKNYYWVTSQSGIKSALLDGPVVAGIEITYGLQDYDGGVFSGYDCGGPEDVNHGVAIVGYDDAGGYWIAKNSWGPSWGEGGFFRIKYGVCGIDSWVLKAVLDGNSYPDDDDDDDDDDDLDDDDDNQDDDDGDDDDDPDGNVEKICSDMIGMIYNGCGYNLEISGQKVTSGLAYSLCMEYDDYWACAAECFSNDTVSSCSSFNSCVQTVCGFSFISGKDDGQEEKSDSCGS